MIACAALAMAAGCAGPPISAYDAHFAARPDRLVSIVRGAGSGRLHVQTVGPSGRRRVVRGFDRYLAASRRRPGDALRRRRAGGPLGGKRRGGARRHRPRTGAPAAGLPWTELGRDPQPRRKPTGDVQLRRIEARGARPGASTCAVDRGPDARDLPPPTDGRTLAGGYLAVTEYGPGGAPEVGWSSGSCAGRRSIPYTRSREPACPIHSSSLATGRSSRPASPTANRVRCASRLVTVSGCEARDGMALPGRARSPRPAGHALRG